MMSVLPVEPEYAICNELWIVRARDVIENSSTL